MEKQETEVNIVEYLLLLLSKWWIILIAALVCGGAMFGYTKYMVTPMYSSNARIYLIQSAEDINAGVSQSSLSLANSLTKDYEELIKGRNVINSVIENLKLNTSYAALSSAVSVTNPEETRLLEITVSNADPVLARDIADEICVVAAEKLQALMNVDLVNIIEKATLSSAPYSPNVSRNVFIGAIAGVACVCAIFLVVFIFDDKIKNPADIEKYLGITTLGLIPEAKKIEERK